MAGAQNYMICFEKPQSCMILLTNSDNGKCNLKSAAGENLWRRCHAVGVGRIHVHLQGAKPEAGVSLP